MNTGIFGEGFPYSNFHDLNMDWIIKIAKDFLDQYTHIQEIIANGEQSIQDLTASGLSDLQDKADELEALLQAWYDTHSNDIANQLASALQSMNTALTNMINTFNQSAVDKAQETLESIPQDYTDLYNRVVIQGEHITDLLNRGMDINKFNVKTVTTGYSIGTDGELRENASYCVSDYIPVKPSTSYTVTNGVNRAFFDANKEYISGLAYSEPTTFTTPSTAKYMRLSPRIVDSATFMVTEQGLYPSVYVPYNEQINNQYIVDILRDFLFNKLFNSSNLFDPTKVINGYALRTDGGTSENSSYCISEYIPIKENTVYIVSESTNRCFYDIDKTFISSLAYSTPAKFTTPANAVYMRCSPLISHSYDYMLFEAVYGIPYMYVPNYTRIPNELLNYYSSYATIGANLFNKDDVLSGYSVRTDGDLGENESYCASDFIPIKGATSYKISEGVNRAFYDSKFNYISGMAWNESATFTTPINAKFMRLSPRIVVKDTFILAETSTYPSTYVPFFRNLSPSVLYQNSISSINPKVFNALGDSFTYGVDKWHNYISQRTGCNFNNYGVVGSCITPFAGASYPDFLSRYEDMTNDCDGVILFGGINDSLALYHEDITLGNIESTSTGTFYGALKSLVEGLLTKYPDKYIFALLPPRIAHPMYLIDDIDNAEIEVFTHYGIPYIDLRTNSTISDYTAQQSIFFGNDLLHWKPIAHQRASYAIQKFLEKFF